MRTHTLFYLGHLYNTSQHPEPAQPTQKSLSTHSIQVDRNNLEPSQATPCKHWSLPSVRVRVRVRVRVGWYLLTQIKKQTGCTHWVPPQIWAYGNSLNVSHRTSIGQMKKIPFVYDLRTVGISGQTLPILNDLMCHTSDNGQMGPPFLFTIYSVVLYLRAVVVHSSGQIDHRSLIFSYYDLHSTCCSMFFRKGSFYCEALARNFTAWGL